jgi:hypothetical protein
MVCLVSLHSLSTRSGDARHIFRLQAPNPNESNYYRCIEDNFETLGQVYDERFAKQNGFFRPYVRQVIYRYPWPRPGLVYQLQGFVSLEMNTNVGFIMEELRQGGLDCGILNNGFARVETVIVTISFYCPFYASAGIPDHLVIRKRACLLSTPSIPLKQEVLGGEI